MSDRRPSRYIRRACLPAQLVEQCLGGLVIGRAEALVEPTVDGGEKIVRLRASAFPGPEARERHRGPQSERFGRLTLGNLQRVPEAALGAWIRGIAQEEKLALQPMQLGRVEALVVTL